jgi:ATP-dependent DNA helicase UvrD/PcrA
LSTPADRKVGRCGDCPSSVDEDLFQRLRAWRLERAQEQQVPAYVVFTDATLTAIAESKPRDAKALSAIPGVGRTKLDRYGSDVLDLCRDPSQ